MSRLARRRGMTTNAVSLMVATVAANVLGLLFWAVAARGHSAHAVGTASGAIAALVLLSSVGQLNLTNIFIRFLPEAGRATRRSITRGYLAVAVASALVGTVYVVSGLGHKVVPSGGGNAVAFVAAVVLLAVFSLQDSVLTALRIANWVSIENALASAAKIALLPAFALGGAGMALVYAWMVPVAAAVVVVNVLLFKVVLPHHAGDDAPRVPPARTLVSFVCAEYLTNLSATVMMQVMPLIVLARAGAEATGYFTIPWLIALALQVLLWNVASSFVVEVVSERGEQPGSLRRGALLWGGLVAAALVGCGLAGPFALDLLLGDRYGQQAGTLLRLVGLSAPFLAVTVLYGAFSWLDQKVWRLAAIQVVTGAVMLGLSLLLLPSLGLAGVGWANLVAHAGAAALMLPSLRSRFAARRVAGLPALATLGGAG